MSWRNQGFFDYLSPTIYFRFLSNGPVSSSRSCKKKTKKKSFIFQINELNEVSISGLIFFSYMLNPSLFACAILCWTHGLTIVDYRLQRKRIMYSSTSINTCVDYASNLTCPFNDGRQWERNIKRDFCFFFNLNCSTSSSIYESHSRRRDVNGLLRRKWKVRPNREEKSGARHSIDLFLPVDLIFSPDWQ